MFGCGAAWSLPVTIGQWFADGILSVFPSMIHLLLMARRSRPGPVADFPLRSPTAGRDPSRSFEGLLPLALYRPHNRGLIADELCPRRWERAIEPPKSQGSICSEISSAPSTSIPRKGNVALQVPMSSCQACSFFPSSCRPGATFRSAGCAQYRAGSGPVIPPISRPTSRSGASHDILHYRSLCLPPRNDFNLERLS